MNRPILVCALFHAATAVLGAQNASQSDPYQGTSNPPADDTIVTSTEEQAKPPAGQPANAQPAPPVPAQAQPEPQPTSVDPSLNYPNPGTDDGIVQAARPAPQQQVLTARAYAPDPDGDIVHPRPLRRGEIGYHHPRQAPRPAFDYEQRKR